MKPKSTQKADYPLNERIKYLRELRKMTQTELAKRTGISQGSLAQFEAGKNSPSVQTLIAMAAALEISPAIFFTTDDVLVFDLKKIQERYQRVEDLPDKLYRDLNNLVLLITEYYPSLLSRVVPRTSHVPTPALENKALLPEDLPIPIEKIGRVDQVFSLKKEPETRLIEVKLPKTKPKKPRRKKKP